MNVVVSRWHQRQAEVIKGNSLMLRKLIAEFKDFMGDNVKA